MIRFIDEHKDRYGVELMCRTLREHLEGGFITSRAYRYAKTRPRCARSIRDEQMLPIIKKVHEENYSVYGAVKLHEAVRREGWKLGRDQVARLMKIAGIRGVIRGRGVKTTLSRPGKDERPDLVKRKFTADGPNQLWVADITYVRVRTGFAYTAFVTDVYSRKIVGWAVRTSMKTQALPLEALNHALASATGDTTDLIHHSDRGSQYVSHLYTQRLRERGIKLSVGAVGDSYDNAMAESVNSLYKTELIYSRYWNSAFEVEYETMNWVHWWNNERLHGQINLHTPKEVEQQYYANNTAPVLATQ